MVGARLELLRARILLEQAEEPAAVRREVPAEEPLRVEERILALAEKEPALLRITAARALEELDPAGAARRYREVLSHYPSSSLTAVARERLDHLDR